MLEFGTTQPYRLYIVRFFSSYKPSVTHIYNNLQFEAIAFIADSEIIGTFLCSTNISSQDPRLIPLRISTDRVLRAYISHHSESIASMLIRPRRVM